MRKTLLLILLLGLFPLKSHALLFSGLPATCQFVGQSYTITDSTPTAYGTVITVGGGSNTVTVSCPTLTPSVGGWQIISGWPPSGSPTCSTDLNSSCSNVLGVGHVTTGILPSANGGAGSANGLLKANGSGVVSAASSGTDYAPATSGSSILKGNGTGGFSSASSSTDYQTPITGGTANQVYTSNGASVPTLKSQPYGYAPFIANAISANSQIWSTGCLFNLTFPANFTGSYPDAPSLASCATPPTLADTYTVKVAGSSIGTIAFPASGISFVNAWVGSGAAGSSNTVSTSSGTQMATGQNEICFLSVSFLQGTTISSISGGSGNTWTVAVGPSGISASNQIEVLYRAVAASDPGATFTVNFSASADSVLGIACFTNSTFDATGTINTGTSTTPTSNGVTTAGISDALLWVTSFNATTSGGVPPPTNFTQTFNVAWASGVNFGLVGGYNIGGYTSGNTLAGSIAASNTWATVAVALKPNSVGQAPTFATTGGATQTCNAGQLLEIDSPSTTQSEANCTFALEGHTP